MRNVKGFLSFMFGAGALWGFVYLISAQAATVSTITVTNLNDSGAGSLRQAIADASASDTIDFNVTGKIILTSGQLTINKDLTISGPGEDQLTISGNDVSRVLEIPAGDYDVSLMVQLPVMAVG